MSFRKAVDQTLIAQLVGRMVRTPLARSVDAAASSSTRVCLYLPYYDEEALDSVIEYLTKPDPEWASRPAFSEARTSSPSSATQTRRGVQRRRELITYTGREGLEAEQRPAVDAASAGAGVGQARTRPTAAPVFTDGLVAVLDAERKKVEGLRGVRRAAGGRSQHRRPRRHRRLRRDRRRPDVTSTQLARGPGNIEPPSLKPAASSGAASTPPTCRPAPASADAAAA